MSCGLACVATGVGGTTEVLDNGNYGILISPNNTEELANALIRLGRSAGERARLGDLARQRILDTYDFQVVGEQYHKLYLRLLGAK